MQYPVSFLICLAVSCFMTCAAGPVETRRATDEDLDQWWQALADADAKKAHLAIWRLSDHPDQAVALFRAHLTPTPKLNPAEVKLLIARLDSTKFTDRDQAAKELAALEELSEPYLRAAIKDGMEADQRRRIEGLLDRPSFVTNPEALRRIRAIEVLERIATPAAREVLKTLASGESAARATREAQAALERLAISEPRTKEAQRPE